MGRPHRQRNGERLAILPLRGETPRNSRPRSTILLGFCLGTALASPKLMGNQPAPHAPPPTPSPEDFNRSAAIAPKSAVHRAGKPELPARSRGMIALAIIAGLLALLGIGALALFMSPKYVADEDIEQQQRVEDQQRVEQMELDEPAP